MDNGFIDDAFYWRKQGRGRFPLLNRVLRRLRAPFQLTANLNPLKEMTTLETRINLFHLVEQVCAYEVRGDLVEFGSYTGETAALIGRVEAHYGGTRTLHIFDSFEKQYLRAEPIRPVLERNLRSQDVRRWEIHEGDFRRTIPDQLPKAIAFAHIDCGSGGSEADVEAHRQILGFLLEHLYPRLSRGAIVALMDYFDPHVGKADFNPAVYHATQAFLADKLEEPISLVSGDISFGFFRKK